MRSRLELQTKLEEISGTKHVYFMPPTSLKMEYPAIRYTREKIDTRNADNKKYISMTRYNVIVRLWNFHTVPTIGIMRVIICIMFR